MERYINALNNSRLNLRKSSLVASRKQTSELTGWDWIEVMDDFSAVWQKQFMKDTLAQLFRDALWEIDGQFFGASYLMHESDRLDSHSVIDLFDQFIRANPEQVGKSLELLVHMAGDAVLDQRLAA